MFPSLPKLALGDIPSKTNALTVPRKTILKLSFFFISEWCRSACGVSTPSDLWGPRSPRAALERPVKLESLTGKEPELQSVKTAKSNQKPFSLFSSQFLFTCQDETEEDWPERNDGGESNLLCSYHHNPHVSCSHHHMEMINMKSYPHRSRHLLTFDWDYL